MGTVKHELLLVGKHLNTTTRNVWIVHHAGLFTRILLIVYQCESYQIWQMGEHVTN